MSRIPRFQEHLKTGFTAEAVSAARYRALAERADRDGMPNLATRWRRLALAKDRLAMLLLAAAGQVRGGDADLGAAIAEERYENDVLYPKIVRDLGDDRDTVAIFDQLLAAQTDHLKQLETLRRDLHGSQKDVQLPAEPPAATSPAVPTSPPTAAGRHAAAAQAEPASAPPPPA